LAIDAAVETCSRLVFGYSGGAAACQGATVGGANGLLATLDVRYKPITGTATSSNVLIELQPCEEVTMQDALDIGWLVIGIAVALGALGMMRRAAR
jgi:hypothetical protein